MPDPQEKPSSELTLTAFIDGACKGNPGPGASAAALYAGGAVVAKKSAFFPNTTNNQAEYAALLLAMNEALRLGCRRLTVKTDSELVARQVNGRYKVKNRNIVPLHREVKSLMEKFERFTVIEIPREDNRLADRLANEEFAKHARRSEGESQVEDK